jgi:hypothetical protein
MAHWSCESFKPFLPTSPLTKVKKLEPLGCKKVQTTKNTTFSFAITFFSAKLLHTKPIQHPLNIRTLKHHLHPETVNTLLYVKNTILFNDHCTECPPTNAIKVPLNTQKTTVRRL